MKPSYYFLRDKVAIPLLQTKNRALIGSAHVALAITMWPNRFSNDEYLQDNPDVLEAKFNPEIHALIMGLREGRLSSLKPIDKTSGRQKRDPNRETVIVVSHEASRTGAPIVALEIAKHLNSTYNVVTLLLGEGELISDFSNNSEALYKDYVVRRSRLGFENKLQRIAKNHAPKFAIVNSLESRSVLEAFRNLNIPTILLVHEFASYTKPKSSVTAAINDATQIVFSTGITRDDALEQIGSLPVEKVSIIPQGKSEIPNALSAANPSSLQDLKLKSKKFRVLGAGYVQYRKGVDLFIEVASEFNNRNPGVDIEFIWFGDGYRPEHDLTYSVYLKDQINRSGVSNKVSIHSAVSDFESELTRSDVFLLTSRLDPLPNVAIDALCSGLPLICFDEASGFPRLAKELDLTQITISTFASTREMVSDLERLYQERNNLTSNRETWANKASKVFDFAAYAKALVNLLN